MPIEILWMAYSVKSTTLAFFAAEVITTMGETRNDFVFGGKFLLLLLLFYDCSILLMMSVHPLHLYLLEQYFFEVVSVVSNMWLVQMRWIARNLDRRKSDCFDSVEQSQPRWYCLIPFSYG